MNYKKLFNIARRPLALLLAVFMLFCFAGCTLEDVAEGLEIAGDIIGILGEDSGYTATEPIGDDEGDPSDTLPTPPIDEDGYYYSKDDVAEYIHTYGKLPQNFITKSEAEGYGWSGGSVERYFDGGAIGGDVFGNREGLLPKASGRIYYECDIDTLGKDSRGAKRIVYSNDGLIYYTPDHYESFTLLYGEE